MIVNQCIEGSLTMLMTGSNKNKKRKKKRKRGRKEEKKKKKKGEEKKGKRKGKELEKREEVVFMIDQLPLLYRLPAIGKNLDVHSIAPFCK